MLRFSFDLLSDHYSYASLIAIAVSFNQSTYSVDKDDGPAQPVLVLSNPSSTDITVKIKNKDITAIGEYTKFNGLTMTILQEVLIMIPDHTSLHFLLE